MYSILRDRIFSFLIFSSPRSRFTRTRAMGTSLPWQHANLRTPIGSLSSQGSLVAGDTPILTRAQEKQFKAVQTFLASTGNGLDLFWTSTFNFGSGGGKGSEFAFISSGGDILWRKTEGTSSGSSNNVVIVMGDSGKVTYGIGHFLAKVPDILLPSPTTVCLLAYTSGGDEVEVRAMGGNMLGAFSSAISVSELREILRSQVKNRVRIVADAKELADTDILRNGGNCNAQKRKRNPENAE